MREVIKLAVDLPLSGKEAKTRHLPLEVDRMLVNVEPFENAVDFLAEMIWGWHLNGEIIVANPFLSFRSAEMLSKRLVHLKPDADLISDFTAWIICSGKETVVEAMNLLDLECVAFCYLHSEDASSRLKAALQSTDFNTTNPEPAYVESCGGGVFYAPSHRSLEIFGTGTMIRERCLRRFTS